VTIDSNISGVRRQVERLRQNVPVAAERTLRPERWEKVAYGVAERTLRALAQPLEHRFVPKY
jgi:hypothetical protein